MSGMLTQSPKREMYLIVEYRCNHAPAVPLRHQVLRWADRWAHASAHRTSTDEHQHRRRETDGVCLLSEPGPSVGAWAPSGGTLGLQPMSGPLSGFGVQEV